MSKNQYDVCAALIAWINSLDYPNKTNIDDASELFDGIIISELMSKIHPEYFNRDHLIFDHRNTMAYIHKNLSYVYDSLEKYYVNVLFKPFAKNSVDVLALTKDKSLSELINMLELVLGAFIQCENREIYIGGILRLDEKYQSLLMHLIEDILQKTGSNNMSSVLDPEQENLQRLFLKMDELENENLMLLKKLQETEEEKDELYSQCVELNALLMKSQENAKNLEAANEKFFLKVGAKSIEEYEDILKLKDQVISNHAAILQETIKKYEEKISNVTEDLESKKARISQLSRVETSLEYYKSKYEEYSKLSQKKADIEKAMVELRAKNEALEQTVSQHTRKIQKYKDRCHSLKEKCIDKELEISKKNTEMDVLKYERTETHRKITRLESAISERVVQPLLEEQAEYDSPRGKASLSKDFSELLNVGNLIPSRKESEFPEPRKGTYNENEEEIESLKSENEILLKKCKALAQENESNRVSIGKLEESLKKLQGEKEDLSQQVKGLIATESDIEIKSENRYHEVLKQLLLKDEKIKELNEKSAGFQLEAQALKEKLENYLEENAKISNELSNLKSSSQKEIQSIREQLENTILEKEQSITDKENELKLLVSSFYEIVLRQKVFEKFQSKTPFLIGK